MATLLSIIQQFCYRTNLPAPAAIVGVSSPTEQQYLSLFKFIGDNLRNRPYQWPQLKRALYINDAGPPFVDGDQTRRYELPGDFYRLLDSTQWDIGNQWPMRGPISDYNMAIREFAVVSLQTRKAYRLIGPTGYLYDTSPYTRRSASSFEITPIPAAGDELFLGYISCNWLWPRPWVASTSYSAGDIRSGLGYCYYCLDTGTSGSTQPSWSTGTSGDGSLTWEVYTEPYSADASNTQLNDADVCLFDEDLMIEGLRWAYLRAKGIDYQQERADWEQQVASAYARFNGPIRVSMSDENGEYADWPLTPQGSWSV